MKQKKLAGKTFFVIFMALILLIAVSWLYNKSKDNENKCVPHSGNSVEAFWIDTDKRIIIGMEDYVTDGCDERDDFYYAANGIQWENQGYIYSILQQYGDIYKKKTKKVFEKSIQDYNMTCNGCVDNIVAFVGV